jgi:hypothetical protein
MVPARLKEWAYAGFAIRLVSALVAHLSIGDGVEAWRWPVGTSRRLHPFKANPLVEFIRKL